MSVRNNIFRIIVGLVLVAVVITLGAFAYKSGVAYGLAQNVDAAALQEGINPAMRMVPFYGYGMPFHGGFVFLRLIGGIFFFFLFIGLIRLLLFPRRHFARCGGMHGRRHAYWGKGFDDKEVPPFVKEMHRKMHEEDQTPAKESAEPEKNPA